MKRQRRDGSELSSVVVARRARVAGYSSAMRVASFSDALPSCEVGIAVSVITGMTRALVGQRGRPRRHAAAVSQPLPFTGSRQQCGAVWHHVVVRGFALMVGNAFSPRYGDRVSTAREQDIHGR